MRVPIGLAAILACAASIAGCGKPVSPARPLAAVSPLPAPSVPGWIAQIAPAAAVKRSAQIRVIFKSPVLAVEQLGSARERDVLSHFRIDPAIEGGFIVLTPRMIGFQSDAALPPATRVRVTLTAGLADLQGHRLDRDLAWTFSTPALKFVLPADYQTPGPSVSLRPVVQVESNAELDAATLAQHAQFVAADGSAVAAAASPQPAPSSGPLQQTWTYDFSPRSDLQKSTAYRFTIDRGVLPARGNLATAQTFAVAMRTYSPLTFTGVQSQDASGGTAPHFAGGDPALAFNNPLDAKTFASHLQIRPAPQAAAVLYALSDDGSTVLVNPFALSPKTTYTVSMDGALQDAYGQHLGKSVQATLTTGGLAPYFWAPTGTNVFLSTQRLQLQYSGVNLPADRYRAAYRVLSPIDVANWRSGYAGDLLADASSWKAYPVAGARPDVHRYIDVPLQRLLNGTTGMLAYGANPGIANAEAFYGTVQLTDLGIFAQVFPQSGAFAVQHLRDGSPAAGAVVEVYVPRSYENAAPARLCARGTTDATGTFTMRGADVDRCYTGNRPASEAPNLTIVAREGADWSYVSTYDWSGVYQYGTNIGDATWSAGQPISRGIVYSDRAMYQPGERGWFTAVCYVLQNGVLQADRHSTYSIRLRDPDGNDVKLPAQRTNRYATFSFPIDFKKSQPLGYYTLVATGPQGAEITGSFRVAQFHPPNFSVEEKLDRKYAAPGDTIRADGSARYLFGAPMTGAQATLHVTREQAYLSPKGWDAFTFGRQWFWPEQPPDVAEDVAQQSIALDANGKGSADVSVARDLPFAMTYRLDFEVTDVSHLASSATQTFLALPSTKLIGLQSDFVGSVNQPVHASAIVTDPDGKPLAGAGVHVELQKMEYSGVTQIVEGAQAARNQVRYTTVAQADVTSGKDPQTISLVAKEPGSYRIRANFAGASSEVTATDSQVWVTGPGAAQWGEQNPSQLQLKLDKDTYSIGDAAALAVASPYDKADLYLSVVRDRVLYKSVVHVNGRAPRVRIPISRAMFPNAAVEGVLVRRGAALSAKNVQGVESLVRIGMVPLTLDLHPRYLSLKIAPEQPKVQPHGKQQVHLHLRDGAGKPVEGQVTLIVADDAILQLTGYRPPDLVQTVFAAQPISTRFADNRPDVTLQQPSDVSEKGWGYGGGFLAGAAGTRVRTQFVPLAYFNGAVQTDRNGDATVSFSVPDNLTTWRIMGVAIADQTSVRFGAADSTFVTTKALVTDPMLPQFARPGDRFDAGLMLVNSTGGPVDARTEALLSGSLSFISPANSQRLQTSQTFAAGINAWRFPVIAGSPAPAYLQMSTTIGGGRSDAFRVPLRIRDSDASETTMESGATSGAASVPLSIGAPGRVGIAVAGSLLPEVLPPAKSALTGDTVQLLSPLAARLSIAASVLRMQSILGARIGSLDARGAASDAVTQLQSLQRIDGSFAFWPGARSGDPFGSSAAAAALAYAKQAGIDVPQGMQVKVKPYLVRILADPARAAKWCTSASCKLSLRLTALQALADLGDRRTDFLAEIYARRDALSQADRVKLALYLWQTPGWRAQGSALANEVSGEIYSTGRYANVPSQPAWYGGQVEAQAAYVRLLVARKAPAQQLDPALRALLAQQCKCGWPSLEDTAAALSAAADYAGAQTAPPNFRAEIVVDGKLAASARFTTFGSPQKTVTLSGLSRGAHRIELRKSGSGTLHYTVTYSYLLGARAPGRLAGLRVIRTVRAANDNAVLAEMDLAPSAGPAAFAPGNVYDVGVRVIVDHPVDGVLIADPLPAGFEALDTSFQTTAAYYQPLANDWQIDYQQIYSDRVTAFAQHLDPGVYAFHYLARTVTPGEYLWPGTKAYLLNAPEQFGRSAFASVTIR